MANEMQKMREAVNVRKFRKIAKNIRRLVDHIRKEKSLSENLAREAFDQIDDLAIEALSEPERNCDLPNPEERFTEFCSRYLSCSSCPHCGAGDLRCDGKWLLAPAKNGGAE